MQIIGPASCTVGAAAGHDGDECRANLLADGRVLCVTCGTVYPKLSAKMASIFRVIASNYGSPKVELGSSIEPGTGEYNASCLCGYDPQQSDRVSALFRRRDCSARLQYYESSAGELERANLLTVGRKLIAAELALMSDHMRNCVSALEAEGFSVLQFQREVYLRVFMTAGRQVGQMGCVIGAEVELLAKAS